jgi:hypothetical protein
VNYDPRLHYAGSVSALGAYGRPSLTGWHFSRSTWILLGFLVVMATLVGLGFLSLEQGGLLAFAAGPTAAVTKREEALAKLLEAKALVQEDQTVKAEDEPRFEALMGEFRALDAEAQKAATQDDDIGTLAERFEYYTGKATGTAMRFNRTQLDPNAPKSLGEQFVQSEAYKQLKASGALESQDSRFRTTPVAIDPRIRFQGAASDIVQTESGGPGAALVQPYRPGIILPLPQRPTVIRDLFANENMPSGDTIEYAAQTGFDNAAAAVAQATAVDGTGLTGGVKPQSSVGWVERTAKASWIATWMATTRQALADESQMRSLIDNQGRLMIRLEEDDQLLNGNGTPPNISGILDQPSIQTLDLTGEDNLDGIRTARRLVKTGLSRLDPTFIIVNPIDSEEVDILKDDNGLYRGGNPIGNFTFDGSIWKLQRVESEAQAEGHATVGARAGATVYERQPIQVLTADQHADFFVRNLVVILFEERIAFPVYFPTAFVDVTLGDWEAAS